MSASSFGLKKPSQITKSPNNTIMPSATQQQQSEPTEAPASTNNRKIEVKALRNLKAHTTFSTTHKKTINCTNRVTLRSELHFGGESKFQQTSTSGGHHCRR